MSAVLPMQIFKSYTLWPAFERLSDRNTTNLELALSAKVIVDRSNVIITCNGILCGMIYQQNYSPGPLDNTSKVLVISSLLIVTWNRFQYEGHFISELRSRIQETGPLLPTLRYVVPEVLIVVLLILEGYRAGGAAGATTVAILFAVLLGLGLSWKHGMGQEIETGVIGNAVGNV